MIRRPVPFVPFLPCALALLLAAPLFLPRPAPAAEPCAGCPPGKGGGAADAPKRKGDPLAELARSKKRVVIADFGQGLCKQCRKQGEILEEVRKAYGAKVEVRFVHVGKEAELAELYEVSMIPYLVYIDPSGTVRHAAAGVSSFEKISDQLRKLGVRR